MGDSIRDRVERGAKLLDDANPNWCMGVTLPTLNMGSCSKCVLGQLFSDYLFGLKELGLTYDGFVDAESNGFTLLDDDELDGDATWNELRNEWERVIVLRRSRRDGWTKIEGDTHG